MRSDSPVRAFFGFLLKTLYIILATLILSEVVMRVSGLAPKVYRLGLGRTEPLVRSENKDIGYEYRPNFRDREHLDPDSPAQTNSFGFRDRERSLTAAPGTVRIVALGDSVMDGNFSESVVDHKWGLYNLDDTIPAQTEKKLGPGYEVLNMGVNGYVTPQEVESFLAKGARFRPDLVFVNFLEINFGEGNQMMGSVESANSPGMESALEFLFVHSDLFRFLSLRFNYPKFKKHVQIDDIFAKNWPEEKWKRVSPSLVALRRQVIGLPYRPDADDHFFEAKNWSKEKQDEMFDQSLNFDNLDRVFAADENWDGRARCRQSLAKLLAKSKQDHPFKIFISVWPTFRDDSVMDLDYGKRLVDPSNKSDVMEIERIARDLGIPVIRLSRGFQAHYRSLLQSKSGAEKVPGPRTLYTVGDGVHPNPLGAEVAATLLREAILKYR